MLKYRFRSNIYNKHGVQRRLHKLYFHITLISGPILLQLFCFTLFSCRTYHSQADPVSSTCFQYYIRDLPGHHICYPSLTNNILFMIYRYSYDLSLQQIHILRSLIHYLLSPNQKLKKNLNCLVVHILHCTKIYLHKNAATIAKPSWSRHLHPPETKPTNRLEKSRERHLWTIYYVTLAGRHLPMEGY